MMIGSFYFNLSFFNIITFITSSKMALKLFLVKIVCQWIFKVKPIGLCFNWAIFVLFLFGVNSIKHPESGCLGFEIISPTIHHVISILIIYELKASLCEVHKIIVATVALTLLP